MSAAAAATNGTKLPLSVRKQDRDTAAKRDEAVAEMTKAWGSPVKLDFDFPTMLAVLEKVDDRNKDNMAKAANEEYAPALAKFLTEAMKEDTDGDVKRELSRHWTTGVMTLTILDKEPDTSNKLPLRVDRACYGGLRILDGNIDCFSVAGGMMSGWPLMANRVGEIKASELLEGGGSTEGYLPLGEHQLLKAALASSEYKQATEDFKALTGQTLKWDGVADGQAVLKDQKVYDILVRNNYGNIAYKPMEVVKCINGIVQAMMKNCQDEMIKEAMLEMFTGETLITFTWTEDSNGYDAPMKEKNCVSVYGSRVQLFQNKVLVTQQASSAYRVPDVNELDFTPIF